MIFEVFFFLFFDLFIELLLFLLLFLGSLFIVDIDFICCVEYIVLN